MDNIQAIEEQLEKLRREIENLKSNKIAEKGESSPDYSESSSYRENHGDFEKLQKQTAEVMKKMIEGQRMFAATCISVTNYNGQHSGIGTTVFNSLDAIVEDGLSAALEPFSNPRRISVLKALIDEPLAANEISKKTGLVGGQLYHHLSNLEDAGLIFKEKDKYHAAGSAQGVLAGLIAVVGGTKIARYDYENR